ncbi:MAG TPA: hypothetical protein PKZ42_13625 [Syntrophales bacterium]|nr:hypothetical protein [Syntrophales bacterium]
MAINASSEGIDSSMVTMLGHRDLYNHLGTVFAENNIIREEDASKLLASFEKSDLRSK